MSELPEEQSSTPAETPFKQKLASLFAPLRERVKSGRGLNAHQLERILQPLQKQGIGFYSTVASVLLSTYFISDLISIGIQSKLPTSQARSGAMGGRQKRPASADDFLSISQRNLFSSDGKMPGEEDAGGSLVLDQGGPPVKTSLPFNLVGTIILRDELRSIATIEDRSASLVYPVRTEDEIPSKARIIKIEPRKVIFVNTATGRREFIDMPEEAEGSGPRVSISTASKGPVAAIERTGNNFNIPRLELDRAFSDLNTILTQARAVPHYENGVPAGYKLFQVMPDGFFGKLGLKDQDVLCGIDGQPVNDPAKALELLGQLKTANHVELCVKREGRTQNFAYDVR